MGNFADYVRGAETRNQIGIKCCTGVENIPNVIPYNNFAYISVMIGSRVFEPRRSNFLFAH